MTIYIANVDTQNDSFGQWIEKTNYLIQAMSNVVVTTNSNTTIGSVKVTGDYYGNNYYSANGGSLFVGQNTSNTVISPNTIVLQTTTTSNVVISSNGMVIDGLTAYTKTFMTLGNTSYNSSNINSDEIYSKRKLKVGNTVIVNTSVYSDTLSTLSLKSYANATIGSPQQNVFIDSTGITIADNPLGSYVVNSYMTATDLWIQRIHANTINLSPENPFVFPGNTYFMGQNNFFQYGIVTSGNSWIGGTHLTVTANTTFMGPNNQFLFNYDLVVANNITAYGHISANNGMDTRDYLTFYGLGTGYTTLKANTDAGSATFTLPTVDGNLNDVLTTDGNGSLRFVPPFSGNSSVDFVTRDINSRDISARSIGVGVPPSGQNGDIRAFGNITAYYSSDRRLKENITNIANALAKLQQINGVEFDWTDNYITQNGGLHDTFMRKHDVGVIAQEVQAIMPEVVVQRSDGYMAVKYEKIIALLIEAVKELKAEVDSLKNGN